MHKREFEGLLETLKIQERDISSFFRVFMLAPWVPQLDYDVDIKDANHAVLTINHYPTLKALEKEGEGREKEICMIVDVEYFKRCATLFSPNLEAFPIDLPPRTNRDGFCCQWEFVLKE
jgi:hypothetical protein